MSREAHVRFCERLRGKFPRPTRLLVSAPPNISPSDIMRRVKGRVSQKVFEEFPLIKKRYWGRHFWARGYFCVTSGELTEEMIQDYLAHHFEKNPNDRFDIE